MGSNLLPLGFGGCINGSWRKHSATACHSGWSHNRSNIWLIEDQRLVFLPLLKSSRMIYPWHCFFIFVFERCRKLYHQWGYGDFHVDRVVRNVNHGYFFFFHAFDAALNLQFTLIQHLLDKTLQFFHIFFIN